MSDVPSLLPPNATAVEKVIEQAVARASNFALPTNPWDPATCPAAFLPWLAWALAVSPWSSDWSEARKRAAIAAAPYIHRHAGTRGALDRALTDFAWPTTVTEWFETEPKADPYTFGVAIDVTDVGIGLVDTLQIAAAIDAAKNERSHLTDLGLVGSVAGVTYVAGAAAILTKITLYPKAA